MAVILIGLALIIAGAFAIFTGYSGESWVTAGLGWAGVIVGTLVTLLGFGKRASSKLEKEEIYEAVDRGQVEVRALVQAMGVVAVADSKVRDQEVATIGQIHEQMLGIKISDTEIREILADFDENFDITSRLVENRSKISPTMKRIIVQSCHMVMVSDLEIVKYEENRVHEIGLALGFDQTEIDDMIASAGI